MRTFAIGDIHGCYNELQRLLANIDADLTKDRLIFTGDYIDRGPASYEVLKFLSILQGRYSKERVILLRGNHEQMLLDYFGTGNELWLHNGAEKTIKSLKKNEEDVNEVISFLKQLPAYFEDEDYIYVHAGLKPGKGVNQQIESDLLWIRDTFIHSSYEFNKKVIFGHTPTTSINGSSHPVFLNGKVAIDTGCVYGGRLSAIEIFEGNIERIHQVGSSSERTYECA